MKLILATRNPHKARELAAMFDLGLPVQTLTEIGFQGEIREDGKTFEENARIKLMAVRDFLAKNWPHADLDAFCLIADDSGLEVDALGGAPGVFSARYAGEADFGERSRSANDKANLQKLLREMQGVPGPKRTARFRCVLAAEWVMANVVAAVDDRRFSLQTESGGHRPPLQGAIFTGVCEGKIGFRPKGKNGFGYDPVFFPEGSCRTFAELSPGEKNRESHRARAAKQLKEWLNLKMAVGNYRIQVEGDSGSNKSKSW